MGDSSERRPVFNLYCPSRKKITALAKRDANFMVTCLIVDFFVDDAPFRFYSLLRANDLL